MSATPFQTKYFRSIITPTPIKLLPTLCFPKSE